MQRSERSMFLWKWWTLAICLVAVLASCDETNPYDPWAGYDPAVQAKADDDLIQNYMKHHNIRDTVKTASGLYYKILSEGTGAQPAAGDSVTVQYIGKYIYGDYSTDVFDSSWKRGQAFKFQLGRRRVIQGWDEGIQYGRVGGRILLFIPSQLAYGHVPSNGMYPDASLIFEVDIVDVKKN